MAFRHFSVTDVLVITVTYVFVPNPDSGSLFESGADLIADSSLPFLNGGGARITIETANQVANMYAVAAMTLDLGKAYDSYQEKGWNGDVQYRLASAGLNAYALYNASPLAKGVHKDPRGAIFVGTLAFGLGAYVEYENFQIKKQEVQWLNNDLERTRDYYSNAEGKYVDDNCDDFFGL